MENPKAFGRSVFALSLELKGEEGQIAAYTWQVSWGRAVVQARPALPLHFGFFGIVVHSLLRSSLLLNPGLIFHFTLAPEGRILLALKSCIHAPCIHAGVLQPGKRLWGQMEWH